MPNDLCIKFCFAKIVQIERNTKEKLQNFYFYFRDAAYLARIARKIVQIERNRKEKSKKVMFLFRSAAYYKNYAYICQ